MANRYWVPSTEPGNGGSGSWSDTAHWSTTSGGSGGASYPSFANGHDAIFDGGSFTLDNQIVEMVGFPCYANNFDTHLVTHTPTFHLPNVAKNLVVTGNFNCTGIVWSWNDATVAVYSLIELDSELPQTISITTGGVALPSLDFTGLDTTTFSLQDDLTITHPNGFRTLAYADTTLALGGHNVANTKARIYHLGSTLTISGAGSTITLSGSLLIQPGVSITGNPTFILTSSDVTVNGITSQISLTGNSSSDRLTLTNNSGSSVTLNSTRLGNTVLNGSNGFKMVDVIDNGGNDWSSGGGGGGGPVRQYHVKIPPTYIALP